MFLTTMCQIVTSGHATKLANIMPNRNRFFFFMTSWQLQHKPLGRHHRHYHVMPHALFMSLQIKQFSGTKVLVKCQIYLQRHRPVLLIPIFFAAIF